MAISKHKNVADAEYRSQLERYCANKLKEHRIDFCYECWRVVLQEGFHYPSLEKIGKVFKETNIVRDMTYNPDFVGDGWIIETKGQQTPDFRIKWKLFKRYLLDNKLNYNLYMPTNHKQVDEVIKIIIDGGKKYRHNIKAQEKVRRAKKEPKKDSL